MWSKLPSLSNKNHPQIPLLKKFCHVCFPPALLDELLLIPQDPACSGVAGLQMSQKAFLWPQHGLCPFYNLAFIITALLQTGTCKLTSPQAIFRIFSILEIAGATDICWNKLSSQSTGLISWFSFSCRVCLSCREPPVTNFF